MATVIDALRGVPFRVAVLLLVAMALLVGTFVFMEANGMGGDGLMQFLTGLFVLLGLGTQQEVKARAADKRLDALSTTVMKIDKQTNGVLDKRIAEGARLAIADYFAEKENPLNQSQIFPPAT